MNTKEVLQAARGLISDPKRWTTKCIARDVDGSSIDPRNKRAVCWCAYGAIEKVSVDDLSFYDVARFLANFAKSRGTLVFEVNDHRGHNAILELFDRAIEVA